MDYLIIVWRRAPRGAPLHGSQRAHLSPQKPFLYIGIYQAHLYPSWWPLTGVRSCFIGIPICYLYFLRHALMVALRGRGLIRRHLFILIQVRKDTSTFSTIMLKSTTLYSYGHLLQVSSSLPVAASVGAFFGIFPDENYSTTRPRYEAA